MAYAQAPGAPVDEHGQESWTYDFWSRLEPDDAGALAQLGRHCEFRKGQALLHQRQVVDRVFLLRSGRVKIAVSTAAGRELILAFRGPGELVGELSAIDEHPRSATVVALEAVAALALPHDAFRRYLLGHPAAMLILLRMVTRRLRDADDKRAESAAAPALRVVASRLLELGARFGEPDGDAVRIAIPLSQAELAGWAGPSLESVGRALKDMRDAGWIETGRRTLRVLDVDALRRNAA